MREKEVSLNGSVPHHYPSQVLSVVVTQERNVSSVHLSFDHLLKGRELLLSAFASSALSFCPLLICPSAFPVHSDLEMVPGDAGGRFQEPECS